MLQAGVDAGNIIAKVVIVVVSASQWNGAAIEFHRAGAVEEILGAVPGHPSIVRAHVLPQKCSRRRIHEPVKAHGVSEFMQEDRKCIEFVVGHGYLARSWIRIEPQRPEVIGIKCHLDIRARIRAGLARSVLVRQALLGHELAVVLFTFERDVVEAAPKTSGRPLLEAKHNSDRAIGGVEVLCPHLGRSEEMIAYGWFETCKLRRQRFDGNLELHLSLGG